MPLPDSTCENCSPGCTSLYEVAHSVVRVAYDAVTCQLPTAMCDDFVGYVSHAEPNHPNGDYVAAWVARVGARDRNTQTSAGLLLPIATAEIAVKLVESGYPTIDSDGPPTFEEFSRAAMHSYSHAESMVRRIHANVGKGGQNRILANCGWMGMTDLVPIRPSGGLIGWTFTVSLTLPS